MNWLADGVNSIVDGVGSVATKVSSTMNTLNSNQQADKVVSSNQNEYANTAQKTGTVPATGSQSWFYQVLALIAAFTAALTVPVFLKGFFK